MSEILRVEKGNYFLFFFFTISLSVIQEFMLDRFLYYACPLKPICDRMLVRQQVCKTNSWIIMLDFRRPLFCHIWGSGQGLMVNRTREFKEIQDSWVISKDNLLSAKEPSIAMGRRSIKCGRKTVDEQPLPDSAQMWKSTAKEEAVTGSLRRI